MLQTKERDASRPERVARLGCRVCDKADRRAVAPQGLERTCFVFIIRLVLVWRPYVLSTEPPMQPWPARHWGQLELVVRRLLQLLEMEWSYFNGCVGNKADVRETKRQ